MPPPPADHSTFFFAEIMVDIFFAVDMILSPHLKRLNGEI